MPSWLIEQRYYLPAFALFMLFRESASPRVERTLPGRQCRHGALLVRRCNGGLVFSVTKNLAVAAREPASRPSARRPSAPGQDVENIASSSTVRHRSCWRPLRVTNTHRDTACRQGASAAAGAVLHTCA